MTGAGRWSQRPASSGSDSRSTSDQPRQRRAIEQRAETLAHLGVIGVEPLLLVIGQQRRLQATSIDRAQRQGFKFQELAKFAFACLAVQYQVFDPHTPAPRTISTRLDGRDHARL